MITRRHIRIDVDLPEITPAQADFLWHLLDDLASDLWEVYEQELLDMDYQRSCPFELENDETPAESDGLLENEPPPPVSDEDTDPDF